ncbi:hypothetical protein ABPG72_004005 [Tetrahymena utriculariae]
MLSQISEHYLSPALAKLSKCFRLSQTVAGVTLLALGNGGPDVATAIIAGSSDGHSIAISVGSIFGAGLFVTTYTLQSVIRNAGSIQIESKTFVWDIIFYLIGCAIVLIYTAVGEINLGMAISFMLVYVMQYCQKLQQNILFKEFFKLKGFYLLQSTKREQKIMNKIIKKKKQLENIQYQLDNFTSMKRVLEGQNNELTPISQEKQGQETHQRIEMMYVINKFQTFSMNQNIQKSQIEEKQEQITKEQLTYYQNDQINYKTIKKQNTASQNKNEEEQKSNDISKDIFTEKYLVIPPADENQWNKYRAVVLSSFFDFNSRINYRGFLLVHLLLIITIAVSLLVLLLTSKEKAPKFMWLFSLGLFLVVVLLLGQAAQILVDFINFFQVVTSMNKTYFLGNDSSSVGQLSYSLASIGQSVMAATGCFAGQAFNLFIGF